MNYQEMSDFEINREVAKTIGFPCYYGDGSYTNGLQRVAAVVKGQGKHGVSIIGEFNPCNSWADAGPIIQDYDISLLNDGDGIWHATHEACWVDAMEWQINGIIDANPLRAAMIVFLMMQEASNG